MLSMRTQALLVIAVARPGPDGPARDRAHAAPQVKK